jgi:predicted MFS family arabinose efflux permease
MPGVNVTTDIAAHAIPDDRLARRNAFVLALAQALAGGNNTVLVATGGIVGAMLAPDKGLATVPISVYVLGLWMGTLPMGALARRFGRRTAFQVGTLFGVLTGLICCVAVIRGSFLMFNIGAFVSGLYASAHVAYRFAAADTASDAFKPKAISWVLVGGICSGIIGSQVVIATKDAWPPYLFAATYLAQAGLAIVAAVVLSFVRIPPPPTIRAIGQGRSLAEIARQPRFIVAVACGVASYAMMNMVMTSAPLAMLMCQHSVAEATLGIQWHVIGMYAPSLFSGALIARFGVERIVALGLLLIVASAVVALSGTTIWNFWIALVLLGVGWNFGFVGATTMVTECHRPNERHKVQAFNDFLVFGSMAVGSFASGQLLADIGWNAVNDVIFPVVLAAGALLLWNAATGRRQWV